MTRRNFLLQLLALTSVASIANITFYSIFAPEKALPNAPDSDIVMRAGWILLDSDQ